MAIFAACRMRTFARLISDELGVRVILKGKCILAKDGKPPLIMLPAMEYASEEVMLPVAGFALHEAGHIKWSDFRVCAEMRSYAEKELHNAIEDEWVEHRLERVFPGARKMLVAAHREGLELVHGRPESIPEHSWLAPEARPEILERFKATLKPEYLRAHPGATEADAETATQEAADRLPEEAVAAVAARLELRRAALCWLYRKRGYDKWVDLREWDTHPWKPVFEEETAVRARDSGQALEQTHRILERLDIKSALPGDKRPSEELLDMKERTHGAKETAREMGRRLREVRRKISRAVRKDLSGNPEERAWDEARQAHGQAERAFQGSTKRAKRASERTNLARERLDRATTRLESLRKRLETCQDADRAECLWGRIEQAEALMARRQAGLSERQRQEEAARHEQEEAKRIFSGTSERLTQAQRDFDTRRRAAAKEAKAEHAEELDNLKAEYRGAKQNAEALIAEHEKLAAEVRERDKQVEAPIQPGVREEVVGRAWVKHRERPLEEDFASLSPEDAAPKLTSPEAPDFSGPARTYTVADRSLDRIEKVCATPQARADHGAALQEQADLIDRLVAALRRVRAPVKSNVKVNVERGRLDAKRLFRVGMALRGAPVDARRVWKSVVTKPDPKVAVSLLLDCSGSMTQMGPGGLTRMQVALRAAAALGAALQELSIPHEILGHTTLPENKGEKPDMESFSRWVPFRGYVFKAI